MIDYQDRHSPQIRPVVMGKPLPSLKPIGTLMTLGVPAGVSVESKGVFTSECNNVSEKPVSTLPQSVLLLSGGNAADLPLRALWDSGSSHCILSPDTAQCLGVTVPD